MTVHGDRTAAESARPRGESLGVVLLGHLIGTVLVSVLGVEGAIA
jgi:hypothetical protein